MNPLRILQYPPSSSDFSVDSWLHELEKRGMTMSRMNLSIYQENVFKRYKSKSQIARNLSEDWCSNEMYCPSCLNDNLERCSNNNKVIDFICAKCTHEYQLKCSATKFRRKINDGEYYTMNHFVTSDSAPNFLLMHYSKDDWSIKNMFLIPRYFISTSIIEKRNPLSANARRAGWTGCNILLSRIPHNGRITIIKNEKIVDKSKVHKIWERMNFLNNRRPNLRGWTSDVLKCVEDLDKDEFTLQEVYHCKEYLMELHPNNLHIEAKIRQQLQFLRDNNIVQFLSKGKYKLLK